MAFGTTGSVIAGSFLRTSAIRPAETEALGSIIETIEIIRKDMIICMVYCKNAIISPTCIWPASIPLAPNHTIMMEMIFIISIMVGIIQVMTRFTNKLVLVKSQFALSKRFSSYFSVENARITGRPVRISRVTRLSLSTSFCITLKRGMAIQNSTITRVSTAATPTAIIQVIEVLVPSTLITPPIPRIGA